MLEYITVKTVQKLQNSGSSVIKICLPFQKDGIKFINSIYNKGRKSIKYIIT